MDDEMLDVLEGTAPPSPETMSTCSSGVALFNPCGLAVGADGRVFIADTGHHRICVLCDGELSVFVGSGARGCADGPSDKAMFAHPCGLAVSPEGHLFVAVRALPSCDRDRVRATLPRAIHSEPSERTRRTHRVAHTRNQWSVIAPSSSEHQSAHRSRERVLVRPSRCRLALPSVPRACICRASVCALRLACRAER